MPTTVTKTVKSSGGDYTSLSAWEAGEQADLVTLDQIKQAECYSFSDTTAVTITGWTTDATHYARAYTPAAERHAGKWDNAKYRISADAIVIIASQNYSRLEGLQVELVATTGSKGGIAFGGSIGGQASQCIVKRTSGSATNLGISSTGSDAKVWNNIIYDFVGTNKFGIRFNSAGNNMYVYNNTVQNCSVGYEVANGTMLVKNCIAQSCTDGFNAVSLGTFGSSDYNLSDLASDAPGANSKNSTTVSFVDAANDDFHLASSDTGAKNSGTDLSADPNLAFSNDIDGDTRGTSWDIGADEAPILVTSSLSAMIEWQRLLTAAILSPSEVQASKFANLSARNEVVAAKSGPILIGVEWSRFLQSSVAARASWTKTSSSSDVIRSEWQRFIQPGVAAQVEWQRFIQPGVVAQVEWQRFLSSGRGGLAEILSDKSSIRSVVTEIQTERTRPQVARIEWMGSVFVTPSARMEWWKPFSSSIVLRTEWLTSLSASQLMRLEAHTLATGTRLAIIEVQSRIGKAPALSLEWWWRLGSTKTSPVEIQDSLSASKVCIAELLASSSSSIVAPLEWTGLIFVQRSVVLPLEFWYTVSSSRLLPIEELVFRQATTNPARGEYLQGLSGSRGGTTEILASGKGTRALPWEMRGLPQATQSLLGEWLASLSRSPATVLEIQARATRQTLAALDIIDTVASGRSLPWEMRGVYSSAAAMATLLLEWRRTLPAVTGGIIPVEVLDGLARSSPATLEMLAAKGVILALPLEFSGFIFSTRSGLWELQASRSKTETARAEYLDGPSGTQAARIEFRGVGQAPLGMPFEVIARVTSSPPARIEILKGLSRAAIAITALLKGLSRSEILRLEYAGLDLPTPSTAYSGANYANILKSLNKFLVDALVTGEGLTLDWGQPNFKAEALERWVQARLLWGDRTFMRQVDDSERVGNLVEVRLQIDFLERHPARRNVYLLEDDMDSVWERLLLAEIPVYDYDTAGHPQVGWIRLYSTADESTEDLGVDSGLRDEQVIFPGRYLEKVTLP